MTNYYFTEEHLYLRTLCGNLVLTLQKKHNLPAHRQLAALESTLAFQDLFDNCVELIFVASISFAIGDFSSGIGLCRKAQREEFVLSKTMCAG